MPVWNGEVHLREAIDSILAQTFRDFEFIILDDGSTDATPSILEEYQKRDPRIRIIQLTHEGIVVALNRGVQEAKAEWIARMDCDDVAHPMRFEKQLACIAQNSNAVLCHTSVLHIGETHLIRGAGHFMRSKALLALRLCHHSPIIHPTVMFRKSIFNKIGGYLPEERHAEDYGLWGRMLENGDVVGVPEALLHYRVHSNSISKKQSETQETLTQIIAKRHSASFAGLSESDAMKTYWILRGDQKEHPIRNWFWFLFFCAPKFKWQSLEMWLWLGSQTLRRFFTNLCFITHSKH